MLVVKSSLVEMPVHWVPWIGAHARCFISGCELCEASIPVKQHGTVIVVDPRERAWVLELSEEHRGICELLRVRGLGAIGSVLRIQLDPKDKLTRHISLLDEQVRARAIPCARYLAALGVKQYDRAVGQLRMNLESQDS